MPWYDHALTVTIFDPQANRFGPSHTGRMQGHEDGACLQIAGGVDQTSDLLRAQHTRGPVVRVIRIWYGVGRKSALQNAAKEETQRGKPVHTVPTANFRACSRWACQ
jgi:hypothetical protein